MSRGVHTPNDAGPALLLLACISKDYTHTTALALNMCSNRSLASNITLHRSQCCAAATFSYCHCTSCLHACMLSNPPRTVIHCPTTPASARPSVQDPHAIMLACPPSLPASLDDASRHAHDSRALGV